MPTRARELGYVPFTAVGSELLFEVFSQRYERGATLVTSNLPFDEWTSIFGSERLTGALVDRLTHHVHILEMNGQSYRLATSGSAHGPARRDARLERIPRTPGQVPAPGQPAGAPDHRPGLRQVRRGCVPGDGSSNRPHDRPAGRRAFGDGFAFNIAGHEAAP